MGDGSPGCAPTRGAPAKPYYKRGSEKSGEGEGYFLIPSFSIPCTSFPPAIFRLTYCLSNTIHGFTFCHCNHLIGRPIFGLQNYENKMKYPRESAIFLLPLGCFTVFYVGLYAQLVQYGNQTLVETLVGTDALREGHIDHVVISYAYHHVALSLYDSLDSTYAGG